MKKLVLVLIFVGLFLFGMAIYLEPVAIIVPHHNVVSDIRLKMLNKVKSKRLFTNTIIILSPDHFSNDQRSIYYSDRTWNYPNGNQFFDEKVGSAITRGLKKNDNLVANDHGIFNIGADVKTVWPRAKVIPILIGQDMDFDQLSNLITSINQNCRFDCLLIDSVDLSHYLPFRLADVHDETSIRTLFNMDLSQRERIEVDSPQAIYTLIQFAKSQRANYFTLYEHTNSAELVEDEDTESTSHVFGWYQREMLAKIQNYQVKTFTLAKKISKKDNLNSLGSRFFYGTDEVKLQLGDGYVLPNGMILPDNVVVAGFEIRGKITIQFLPLKCKVAVCVFARGKEKIDLLQSMLSGVDNQNGEIVIIKN